MNVNYYFFQFLASLQVITTNITEVIKRRGFFYEKMKTRACKQIKCLK